MNFEIWRLLVCIGLVISACQAADSTENLAVTAARHDVSEPNMNPKSSTAHSRLTGSFDALMNQLRSDPNLQNVQQQLSESKKNTGTEEALTKELQLNAPSNNESTVQKGVQLDAAGQDSRLARRAKVLEMNRTNANDSDSLHDQSISALHDPIAIQAPSDLAAPNGLRSSALMKEKANFYSQNLQITPKTTPSNLHLNDDPVVKMVNGSLAIVPQNGFQASQGQKVEDRGLNTQMIEQQKKETEDRLLNLKEELRDKKELFVQEKARLHQLIQSYNAASDRMNELKRNTDIVKKTLITENSDYQKHYHEFQKFSSEREAKRNYLQNEYRKNQLLNQQLQATENELKAKNQFMQTQIKELEQKKGEVLAIDEQLKQHKQRLTDQKVNFKAQYEELQTHFKQLSEQKEALKTAKEALETSKTTLEKQIEGFQKTQKSGEFLQNQIDKTKEETDKEQVQLTEIKKAYNAKLEELIDKLKELEKFKEVFQQKQFAYNSKNANVSFHQRKVNEKQLLLDRKEKILIGREADYKEKERVCQCGVQSNPLADFSTKPITPISIPSIPLGVPINGQPLFTFNNNNRQLNEEKIETSNKTQNPPLQNTNNSPQLPTQTGNIAKLPPKADLERMMIQMKVPQLEIFNDPYFKQKKFFSS